MTSEINVLNNKKKRYFAFSITKNEASAFFLFTIISLIFSYVTMLYSNTYTKCVNDDYISVFTTIVSSIVCGSNSEKRTFSSFEFPFSSFLYDNQHDKTAFNYPIIPSYFTATLMTSGRTSMRYALFFPSFFILLSLFFGIYYLTLSGTKSKKAALISVPLLIFLGGFGFISFIRYLLLPNNNSHELYDWIHHYTHYYKKDGEIEIRPITTFWRNFLLDYLLPNPNTLWGFTLAIWTMVFFQIAIKTNYKQIFILSAIFISFIPQCSPNIFISVSLWCFLYYFTNKPKSKKFKYTPFKYFIFVMAFPSLIQLLPFIISQRRTFGLHFNILWKNYPDFSNPISLWVESLGLFFIASLTFSFYFLSKEQIKSYIPSLVVFIIFHFIGFINEYERLHPFYVCWIPFAIIAVSEFYSRIISTKGLILPYIFNGVFAALMIGTCLSGFISLVQIMITNHPLIDYHDISIGKASIETIEKESSVFIYPPDQTSAISIISGRKIFPPRKEWLDVIGETYDLKYENADDLIKNCDLLKSNNIRYLYYTKSKKLTPNDLNCWRKIIDNYNSTLYYLTNV